MRAVKYSERCCRQKARRAYNGACVRFVTFHTPPCIFFLLFFLFPLPAFILSLSPLNLPTKSTLATGNYNEQLHMAAPPAAEIRRGSTAHTHSHTHTHTHTRAHTASPILSPSSQNNRLLPNSALIFCVNNTDISPPSTMKGGGRRGRTEGRQGKEKKDSGRIDGGEGCETDKITPV